MKLLSAILVGTLGLLPQLCGQNASAAPKTATIAGVVIKEPGSQPLKKVLLHLIAEDQKEGGNHTTDTDQDGRFRFAKIQPGRYQILMEKTGFHQVNLRGHQADGAMLNVRAGQEITDLLFTMIPSAVITGKIVDEDGEPLPYYGVSLLKRRPGPAREPKVVASERTNDLGEYRFGGLFPGQYLVVVIPAPDNRNFERPAQDSETASAKPDLNYLVTYYPGTTDSTQASPISVRAGDEIPINFTLIPSRTYRVRGIVTGIPPKQKPIVQLISKGVNNSFNGAEVAPDGQFEVRGIAPGSYTITAFSTSEGQSLTARETVTVVAGDVEGIRLVPARPFAVSGHVRLEDWTGMRVTDFTVGLRPDVATDDSVAPAAADAASNAKVDRFGNFEWTNVMPGYYIAEVFGGQRGNTYLKSVTVGSSPADTGFRLTGPASVELMISSLGGFLSGAVLDRDKPATNATVVAVPEEKYRKIHERYGVGTSDQNGSFTIRGLAPGTYTVFAWQGIDDGLYYDAAFLDAQKSNGVTVNIEEGKRRKAELSISAVSEEWQ